MEIEQIRKLVEELTDLMDARKLDELKITSEGVKVVLRRGGRKEQAPLVLSHGSPVPHVAPPTGHVGVEEPPEHGHVIHAPMVGTFYRAPAPDADNFVEVGDQVTPDTVLCIIEAMKVLNELKAEMEGTIREVRVENGEAVEYGQTLFVIEPRGQA